MVRTTTTARGRIAHRTEASKVLSRDGSTETMRRSSSTGAPGGTLIQVAGFESGQNNFESMIQAVGLPGPGPAWQRPPFGVRWTVNSPLTPYARRRSGPLMHRATESCTANQARQSARLESCAGVVVAARARSERVVSAQRRVKVINSKNSSKRQFGHLTEVRQPGWLREFSGLPG